ncbi:MAG: NADP-dependent malic enzyme [bacterium]|nr:NADP-dependent malic enzyme [bacterium]
MSDVKMTKEELIAKAQKPAEDAMKLHPFFKGKLQVTPKCVIRDFDDFAIWYTPGVAAPCKDIAAKPDTVFKHTNKANFVAIVSDGTRVLGLGDIGPEAAIPVMEGKGILFKYLGGVDAFPICLDTKDPDEIIDIVLKLQPVFGGVNLEDIAQPKCFKVLDTLREKARIPIWHDDQQGTAAVTVAGLINALRLVEKKMDGVKIAMIGAGASNIAISRMMIAAGVPVENIVMYDSKGALHPGRDDIMNDPDWKEKAYMCKHSNKWGITGAPDEGVKGADVLIALSKSEPGTVKKEWVSSMADDAVVFTCANPLPEIWPWDAKEAGARIVATGRSDFPNQVNNSLGFPGIFRGTLDVQATTITDEMCIAAAYAMADHAYSQKDKFNEEYLVPTMDDWEIYPKEATAVGLKAIEQGVARLKFTEDELFQTADTIIKQAREETHMMMDKGFIAMPPDDL